MAVNLQEITLEKEELPIRKVCQGLYATVNTYQEKGDEVIFRMYHYNGISWNQSVKIYVSKDDVERIASLARNYGTIH